MHATDGLVTAREKLYGFLVAVLLFIATISFIGTPGTSDVGLWLESWWMPSYEQYGLVKGYAAAGDNYPPLSFVTIGFIGTLSRITGSEKLHIFKIVNLFFLLSTVMVFYIYSKKIRLSILLYLSLIINVLGLGYIDVYFAPFLIGAIFALKKRKYVLSACLFAVASQMKYQPLIMAPFIFLFVTFLIMDGRTKSKKDIYVSVLFFILIVLISILIFGPHAWGSVFEATKHGAIAPNALNFNWIIGHFVSLNRPGVYESITIIDASEYPTIRLLSRLLFYSTYIMALYEFLRHKKNVENMLIFSIIGFLSYFVFNIGVHENHSFAIILLCGTLASLNMSFEKDFIMQAILANLNLVVFYGLAGSEQTLMWGGAAKLAISGLTLAVFAHFVFTARRVLDEKALRGR